MNHGGPQDLLLNGGSSSGKSTLALWNKHLPILLTAALLVAPALARRWDLPATR
jgi:hypothetical protein